MTELSTFELAGHLAINGAVLDIRSFEKFTSGFLSGSIFLNPDRDFKYFYSLFITDGTPLVFITESCDISNINEILTRIGIEEIKGYIPFNAEEFTNAGLPLDLIIRVEPDELEMDLKFDDHAQAVDLRSLDDYQKGHIRGARSLPLPELNDIVQIASLDDEGTIYFYAADDDKSATAASLLKRQGLHNLRIVTGGWESIKVDKTIDIEVPKPSKS